MVFDPKRQENDTVDTLVGKSTIEKTIVSFEADEGFVRPVKLKASFISSTKPQKDLYICNEFEIFSNVS